MAVPRSCCTSGSLWEGSPRGQWIEIAGMKCYESLPSTAGSKPDKAVIVLSDVFGAQNKNVQLLADKLAVEGFVGIVADYFDGNAVPLEKMSGILDSNESKIKSFFRIVTLIPWFLTEGRHFDRKIPRLNAVAVALKQQYNVSKVFVKGYCYGGILTSHLAAYDTIYSGFVMNHPGNFDIEKLVPQWLVPGHINMAEIDRMWGDKDRKKLDDAAKKLPYHIPITNYDGVRHGFASRGDQNDEKVAEARDDVFARSVALFNSL